MTTYKAIETKYNGFLFRSRLEARWGVFFDTLGIEYRYEPEGFDLNGIRYLPDFYLPQLQTWIEIKPNLPTHEEREKAIKLTLAVSWTEHAIIFAGDVWHTVSGFSFAKLTPSMTKEKLDEWFSEYQLYWLSTQESISLKYPIGFNLHRGFFWGDATWYECTRCKQIRIASIAEMPHKCEEGDDNIHEFGTPRLIEAFTAARQARF